MGLLSTTPPRIDHWTATRWSVVAGLSAPDPVAARRSWEELLRDYQAPLLRYASSLLRRLGTGSDVVSDAEEALQSFLTACVEKGWLSRAAPERGRFRAFLQALLKRHIWHVHRHRTAQRRHPGPGRSVVPLLEEADADAGLLDDGPERLEFDRGWVELIVERALLRLHARHERYALVIRDLIRTHGEGSADLPEQLGIRREQLPVVKHRAREQFARLFTEEIAATVADDHSLAEEWTLLAPLLP